MHQFRKDAPTSTGTTQNMLFSLGADEEYDLEAADCANAYFQGRKFERELYVTPPSGFRAYSKVAITSGGGPCTFGGGFAL